MQSLIQINNLSKSFGSFLAVKNISFNLKKGEVLGFLGPNGAGKTTTMRMIAGFLKPTSGQVIINKLNMNDFPEDCKKIIGYVPEGAPLYEEMTGLDFLKFVAKVRKVKKGIFKETLDKIIILLNLEAILFKKIEVLSKGYKRRIGLAQALLHDPEILILDEPTDGLDPKQKNEVRRLIKKLGRDKAIIISTHILEEVNAICNRAMIIADGKVLIDEKPNDILKKSMTHNSIYLSVDGMNASQLKKDLINKNVSKNIKILDSYCVIKTDYSKLAKNKLDNYILKYKIRLKHYSVGKGNFEEVFMRLTNNE